MGRQEDTVNLNQRKHHERSSWPFCPLKDTYRLAVCQSRPTYSWKSVSAPKFWQIMRITTSLVLIAPSYCGNPIHLVLFWEVGCSVRFTLLHVRSSLWEKWHLYSVIASNGYHGFPGERQPSDGRLMLIIWGYGYSSYHRRCQSKINKKITLNLNAFSYKWHIHILIRLQFH